MPAKEKDFQTLHEYEAHKESLQPKANAWGARNNAARSDNLSNLTDSLPPTTNCAAWRCDTANRDALASASLYPHAHAHDG